MEIILPAAQAAAIARAAETAWPDECCGLLTGRALSGAGAATRIEIARAVATRNVAADPKNRFEIDPQTWLDLEMGPEQIVGLYHSHPSGTAEPSPRDFAAAWGDRLVWLITAVEDGRAGETRAYLFREGGEGFTEVELRVAP